MRWARFKRSRLRQRQPPALYGYDFYVYSAFSLYFAKAFFPAGDQTAQLLNTAAIFAVGFLMRPIGAWLFGRMADRHGRRVALTTSVLLMCFGSGLVAVTPVYATIGITAPVILLLARMIQGSEPWRRIRHERHLSFRDGDRRPPRLLFEFPVRDADRRSADGDAGVDRATEGRADARRTRRLGMAHSVRDRCASFRCRVLDAARSARDGSVPTGDAARRLARSAGGSPARGRHRRWADARRNAGLLHVHDIHAKISGQHLGFSEGHRDADFGVDVVRLHAVAACRR